MLIKSTLAGPGCILNDFSSAAPLRGGKRVKLSESSKISGIIRYLLPPYPPAGPKMEPRGVTGRSILHPAAPLFGVKFSHRFSDAVFPAWELTT